MLYLPRMGRPQNRPELCLTFNAQLRGCFGSPLPVITKSAGDDWAKVKVQQGQTDRTELVERPVPGAQKPHYLPNVAALPRPDELLLKPPYHLIIHSDGRSLTELHCSHSPTLEFLADYLRRWCRVNHTDTRQGRDCLSLFDPHPPPGVGPTIC